MRAIELYGSLDIKEIDCQLVLSAISLQKKYLLSYWDSLIVSAAKGSMCRILYSEDLNSGQDIEGVVIVNPFQSGEKSLLNELPIYTN
jgi:predicted nucleic acid-binding protein